MIHQLSLENFQSHKHSRLEFSDGVNIIIGTSDSGKTAILRALRWVVTNRPSGDAFRSRWGGETSVEIDTDEGIVIRSKDKIERYIIGKEGKKDLEFKAFGTTVPKEITELLNLSEINIQGQLDAPFLLSKSAGEVATHFNKVARLDKIDTATANVNSWIRELTADIKYKKAEKEKLEVEVERFQYLTKFEIDVEVLEGMETNKKGIINKLSKVTGIVDELKEIQVDIDVNFEILRIEDLLMLVLAMIEDRDEKKLKRKKLQLLVISICDIEKEIEVKSELSTLETNVTDLLQLYRDKETMTVQFSRLNKAVKSVNGTSILFKQKEAEFDRLHKTFEDNFPDVCPLCGQEQS